MRLVDRNFDKSPEGEKPIIKTPVSVVDCNASTMSHPMWNCKHDSCSMDYENFIKSPFFKKLFKFLSCEKDTKRGKLKERNEESKIDSFHSLKKPEEKLKVSPDKNHKRPDMNKQ